MASATAALRRRALAWGAAAVGLAIVLVVFHPGILMDEAIGALYGARVQHDYDDNSPVFAWLLGRFDGWLPGGFLMLALQGALFFAGLALTALEVCRRDRWIPVVVLGVGLWPINLYLLGLVLKDVHFVASLTLATALLLGVQARPTRRGFAGAIAALLYASTLRHNAPAAVLPLALWCGVLAARALDRAWARRRLAPIALGLALAVGLAGSARLIRHAMIVDSTHQYQITLLHDLAAISLAEGRVLIPRAYTGVAADGRTPDPLANLELLYDPFEGQTLFWPNPERVAKGAVPYAIHYEPEVIAEVRSAWRDAILARPGVYLRHRLGLLHGMLTAFSFPERPDTYPNDLGVAFAKNRLNQAVQGGLARLQRETLFRAWPYLVLLLALALACRWLAPEVRAPVLALAASGFLFELSFLAGAFTTVFKYNWWMIEASLLALVVAAPPLIDRLLGRLRGAG